MFPIAEIVEGRALLDSVLFSLAAAIGVSIAFSTALWGATRAVEASRDDRTLAAFAAGVVMTAGLLVCAAAVVFGVFAMTSK